MAAPPPTKDQVLSLLAAANNHGDLSVKTSSLKQAKDLLLSLDPSLAADLYPYLLELQSSPESLVRKLLIQSVPLTLFFFFQLLCLQLIHRLLTFSMLYIELAMVYFTFSTSN